MSFRLLGAGALGALLLGWGPLLTTTLGQSPRLPAGVAPLEAKGDLASQMVDGIDRFLLRKLEQSTAQRESKFQRDFSSPKAYQTGLAPARERLSVMLGLRERPKCESLEYVASTSAPSLIASSDAYEVHRVRWPGVSGAVCEGLLLEPRAEPQAYVLAIPDADQTPEQIAGVAVGLPPKQQCARRLAERDCLVLVPALVSRDIQSLPVSKPHDLTNREFLYRSAFELGRHLIGYELQGCRNALDWFRRRRESAKNARMGVCGYGEGGMLALYLAALEPDIDATVVSGYFQDRNAIWKQPIDRNVFGLLTQFGDAELATMVAPRRLIVEASPHPEFIYPPGKRGAPAVLKTPPMEEVSGEVARARRILEPWEAAGNWLAFHESPKAPLSDACLADFLGALGVASDRHVASGDSLRPEQNAAALSKAAIRRTRRLIAQYDRINQETLRESPYQRREFMKGLDFSSPEAYRKTSAKYRDLFRKEIVGQHDVPLPPPNPRARLWKETDSVTYYEVVLDVFPDVFAYGLLCLPKDLQPGEKRPVVVCQHGLEGRASFVVGQEGYRSYKAFGTRLAERGYITFAPQNPYIFRDRFRSLQRKSYPLNTTLFSIIVPQHQQIVDWLQTLPFVEPDHIAFYGLSYGGKTAMRVPALVEDYCLSICSADFNDWVDKNASTRNPRSYIWTGEYEIFEWNLGGTFNYAEMAALIAPRPFMVERGHFDGVADDWTVAWEFAKVRHLYQAQLKLKDRCAIEWFDGPHTIHGVGTFQFLDKHLDHSPR